MVIGGLFRQRPATARSRPSRSRRRAPAHRAGHPAVVRDDRRRQHEVAPFRRPVRRVVGILDERRVRASGGDMQVRQQHQPVAPRVRRVHRAGIRAPSARAPRAPRPSSRRRRAGTHRASRARDTRRTRRTRGCPRRPRSSPRSRPQLRQPAIVVAVERLLEPVHARSASSSATRTAVSKSHDGDVSHGMRHPWFASTMISI